MIFEIKHRYSGSVLFSFVCGSMKQCVEAAVASRANLAGANLAGANLADANLAGANLADAYLADAYLAGANLADANLARANIADANLADAYLADANLADAYLAGAKWPKDAVVPRPPVCIAGLLYRVMLFGSHMQIGCEVHSVREWDAFDDERIVAMYGRNAIEFWRANKSRLLAFRDTEAEEQFAAKSMEAATCDG
jgi:hypothetical protein